MYNFWKICIKKNDVVFPSKGKTVACYIIMFFGFVSFTAYIISYSSAVANIISTWMSFFCFGQPYNSLQKAKDKSLYIITISLNYESELAAPLFCVYLLVL
jgi:hypothetical protein